MTPLVVLWACAHPTLAVRPEQPALPEVGPTVARSTAVVASPVDGTELFVQTLVPRDAAVRAVLVVQHGLKDHGDHYVELAERLVARGFAVTTYDLRGHGRSAGPRVTVDDFDDYVTDLAMIVARARAEHPELPVFLLGHSMGGSIAARYVVDRQPTLAGLVLSAPAVRLDLLPLVAASTLIAGRLLPNLGALKLPDADFSSDPAVVAAMSKDPLIYHEAGPARTAMALGLGAEGVWAQVERLTMPLLLLHGTNDKLTAPAGSRDLYRAAPSADKTLRLYDGFMHDLLHEPGKERVLSDVVTWLDDHAAGRRTEAPAPDLARGLGGEGWKPSLVLRSGGLYESGPDGAWRLGGVFDTRVLLGRRVGWALGLAADAAASDGGFTWGASFEPIGLGVAGPSEGFVAMLTAGVGLRDRGGEARWDLPVDLYVEVPLPLRTSLFLEMRTATVEGSPGGGQFGVDEVTLRGGARLGDHHRFFPGAAGGAGPYLALVQRRIPEGPTFIGLELGNQLTGLRW